MARQIKISDEIYDRLKKDADANYRSLGGHIEYLMDKAMGVSNILGEKVAFTKDSPTEPTGRSVGDILADIRKLEGERDEELRFSQDGDYSEGITRSYGERIQDLWNEYHLVTPGKA